MRHSTIGLLRCGAVIFSLLMSVGNSAAAQWYFQAGNAGPIAVLNLTPGRGYLFAFEYERNCSPLFGQLNYSSLPLGSMVSRRELPYGAIRFVANGTEFTWYGGEISYTNAREMSVGVTTEAWTALQTTRDIEFITPDGRSESVPAGNLKQALSAAFSACSQAVR
jgi:hypothetical protein